MCTTRETSNYLLKFTEEQLDPLECLNFVSDSKAGGNFLFIGTTRDTEGEAAIAGLQYEVYEDMAMELMKQITMEVLMKYSDVLKVAIIHRKGWVPVSNASFMVAVSGGHRCDPHSAVLYIINQVKAKVPIWKKIIYQAKLGEEKVQKDHGPSSYLMLQKQCANQNGQNVTDEHLMSKGELLLSGVNCSNYNSSSSLNLETKSPKSFPSASAQPDTPLNHWSTSSEAFWKTIK